MRKQQHTIDETLLVSQKVTQPPHILSRYTTNITYSVLISLVIRIMLLITVAAGTSIISAARLAALATSAALPALATILALLGPVVTPPEGEFAP